MSRTQIMLSCFSLNNASPMTSSTAIPYPRVSHLSDASTRAGVCRSPSRFGSSPSCSSMSRTSVSKGIRAGVGSVCASWKLCRLADFISSRPMWSGPVVVHVVTLGLPQPDAREARGPHRGLEHAPTHDRDVLGRGDQLAKPGHVDIQVLVVQVPDQALGHDLLQAVDVEHVAGGGIDLPFDRDVEIVVVAVEVGVVAHAEHALVLRIRKARIVETVGGVEVHPARDNAARHCLFDLLDRTNLGSRAPSKATRLRAPGG